MNHDRQLPTCPHLPDPGGPLDYRVLSRYGTRRDAGFYESALVYAHHLWRTGHAGRSLLALTRALYADLPENDPVLSAWPLPYAAVRWILAHHDSDDFPGNPRLSFQHQACRLRGERREIRMARAWAMWALACAARPTLTGDPTCPELLLADISSMLRQHGHTGEDELWKRVLNATSDVTPISVSEKHAKAGTDLRAVRENEV